MYYLNIQLSFDYGSAECQRMARTICLEDLRLFQARVFRILMSLLCVLVHVSRVPYCDFCIRITQDAHESVDIVSHWCGHCTTDSCVISNKNMISLIIGTTLGCHLDPPPHWHLSALQCILRTQAGIPSTLLVTGLFTLSTFVMRSYTCVRSVWVRHSRPNLQVIV